MSTNNEASPFELLKTFSGLIHRQPLFITNRLDVDSYHLTFLDKYGDKLDDDSEAPSFVEHLTDILPAISDRQQALLSMPESWQATLSYNHETAIELTLDLDDIASPRFDYTHFSFATHAEAELESTQSDTLLIDLQQYDLTKLTEHLPYWRKNHKILCATNVNNFDDYALCKSNYLDLLQGQFYTTPAAKDNLKILPSTLVLMSLLVKLQDPNVDPEELAAIINQDIALSYKLLRLINSAFFGMPHEISNIQQAIVLLGHTKIKTWASLLSLSGIEDKPVELRVVAMTRARMRELLAKYYGGQPETLFAAGLFSTLDALIDKPLPTLIATLPLSPELNEALLNKTGPAGFALRDVLNYEQGDWNALTKSPVPAEILTNIYLDAIHWAKELNTQLHD